MDFSIISVIIPLENDFFKNINFFDRKIHYSSFIKLPKGVYTLF